MLLLRASGILLLVAAFGPVSAVAQTKAIGPGGGGAEYCAAIHPQNPNIMLMGQDVGGILKSIDGGANWRHVNTGLALPKATLGSLGVVEIVFAPGDPSLVFASTWSGHFRSAAGADSSDRRVLRRETSYPTDLSLASCFSPRKKSAEKKSP